MSETKSGPGKAKLSLGALLLALLVWGAQRMGLIELPSSASAGGGATAEAPAQPRETPSEGSAAPTQDYPTPPTAGKAKESVQEAPSKENDGAQEIAAAFKAERSGFMVEVSAPVERMLPDDNDGSRHQRFILRLSNDMTLLVAHNIDLAPRVPLDEGDPVTVYGQYEWSDRGGVLHWTHHDPGGHHDEGWIRHAGKVYE